MSKTMWILAILITITVIASVYREQSGMELPAHLKCKESMLQQIFSDLCTPRSGLKNLK